MLRRTSLTDDIRSGTQGAAGRGGAAPPGPEGPPDHKAGRDRARRARAAATTMVDIDPPSRASTEGRPSTGYPGRAKSDHVGGSASSGVHQNVGSAQTSTGSRANTAPTDLSTTNASTLLLANAAVTITTKGADSAANTTAVINPVDIAGARPDRGAATTNPSRANKAAVPARKMK